MDNNYFTDREALAKFIDELIKKKALSVNNAEELNELREKSIQELDDEIGAAIFATLSDEQLDKLNELIDKGEDTEEVYDEFFTAAGTDFEKVTTDTMRKYAAKFLGGENGER